MKQPLTYELYQEYTMLMEKKYGKLWLGGSKEFKEFLDSKGIKYKKWWKMS